MLANRILLPILALVGLTLVLASPPPPAAIDLGPLVVEEARPLAAYVEAPHFVVTPEGAYADGDAQVFDVFGTEDSMGVREAPAIEISRPAPLASLAMSGPIER